MNVVHGPEGDPDGDGLFNGFEFDEGTDPRDVDTDNDGLWDVSRRCLNTWLNADSTGTSPLRADSDTDGISDGNENPDLAYAAGVRFRDGSESLRYGWRRNQRPHGIPAWHRSHRGRLEPANRGGEQPQLRVAGHSRAWFNGVPDGWTFTGGVTVDDSFAENTASVGMTGGAGAQFGGIQEPNAYLHQDNRSSIQREYDVHRGFSAGGYRNNYATGIVEFGLFSSTAVGTRSALMAGESTSTGR